MTPTINPLNQAIEDGYGVRDALREDALQMRLALENRHYALQAHQTAKANYGDAESEFLADFTYTDNKFLACKNAEAREICKDAALVKARSAGILSHPWRSLNDTRMALDNAELAYAQADAAFKAVRIAAELTASLLRAASI